MLTDIAMPEVKSKIGKPDTDARQVGTVIALFVLGFAILITLSNARQRKWEEKITTLHQQLELGMRDTEVLRIAERADWPDELIHESEGYIRIETPLTWGAKNWILNCFFERGSLSAVRVRTLDSDQYRPHVPAPPDLESESETETQHGDAYPPQKR